MSSLAQPLGDDSDPTPELLHSPLSEFWGTTGPSVPVPNPLTSPVPPPAGEAIRQLLNRFEMSTGQQLPAVIAVASALRGEGVTTLSRSLASILATDLDADVVWIDLSWSAPASKPPSVRPIPGVSEVLRGSTKLSQATMSDPAQARLRLIPLGDQTRGDQARLARSPRLADMIMELTETNRHVVIDAGAVLDSTEAPVVVRQADAYLLVVRQGTSTIRQVQIATEELSAVPLLGAVLNQHRTRTPSFIRDLLDR